VIYRYNIYILGWSIPNMQRKNSHFLRWRYRELGTAASRRVEGFRMRSAQQLQRSHRVGQVSNQT
jgi:hypothetical protein